jgi:hypothetical protein
MPTSAACGFVSQCDETSDADDLPGVGRYGGKRLMAVMVDPREAVQIALAKSLGHASESPAARLVAQLCEGGGQAGAVARSERSDRDAGHESTFLARWRRRHRAHPELGLG